MTAMSCSSGGPQRACSAACWRCRPRPPAEADWRGAGAVDHVFTHFALTMDLKCATGALPPDAIRWPVERIGEAGLPTLFAKLAARGLKWSDSPSPTWGEGGARREAVGG